MLRRFIPFRKGKKDQINAPSTDEKSALQRRRGSLLPQREHTNTANDGHSADREEVERCFKQYAQLIHASRRPLPTQSGDGAYLEHELPSGLMQDLINLGFKDVQTLMQVMKSKATGGLQDDKTYLMERVIQVRMCSFLPTC